MTKNTHTVILSDDMVLVPQLKQSKPGLNFGQFTAISRLRESSNQAPDLLDLFESLPPSCLALFNKIKLGRDKQTNICVYTPTYKTRSEREVVNRYIRQMVLQRLIRRIPSSHFEKQKGILAFILNPEYIRCFNMNKAEELWRVCS